MVNKKWIFIGIFIVIYLIIFSRLFYLQLLNDTYKQFAERNVLQRHTIYPLRGLIFDRNMDLMVSNETIYDLMVVPSMVSDLDTAKLIEILDISLKQFENRMQSAIKYSRFSPSVFVKQLSKADYGVLQERMFLFRGFFVQARTSRSYDERIAAHLLGYLGEVNHSHIEHSEGYYKLGDYIGISGLERVYENDLKGVRGEKNILVDVFNRVQGSYMGGKLDVASEPGNHLITTINKDLQAYGEILMKNKSGSIVAIEPASGEVLALVSSPAFDPSMFTGRNRASNFNQLVVNEQKPLFNRAISATYPPGSTFKMIQALVGLEERVIKHTDHYVCRGGYFLPGLTVRCHAHTPVVNMELSIRYSCNAYYCELFRRIIDQKKYGSAAKGYEKWLYYMGQFALLDKIGLDIPNEQGGFIPERSYYDKLYGQGGWRSSTILSLSIGQGEIDLTPLQMANLMAIIANRGYYVKPHLVKGIMQNDSIIYMEKKKIYTSIDSMNYEYIIQAMVSVVDQGTGWRSRIEGVKVAGKTGTSQNPHGENHSLYVAFAPADNPKIAIAVVVENSGYGGSWAAPIAGLMMQKYLKAEISNTFEENRILDASFILEKEEEVDEVEQ